MYFHLHVGEKFINLCLSLHSSRSNRTVNNWIEITEIQVLVQSLNVFSVSFYDIHVAVWTLLTSYCCCRGHLCRLPEGQALLQRVCYTELPKCLSLYSPYKPFNRIKVKPFPTKCTLFYCFPTQTIYCFQIRFILYILSLSTF